VRFLLRPGWLAFIGVVLAFVVACYALLAPWQFDREAQRDAQQRAIDAAAAAPPVPLAELVPPGAGVDEAVQWRVVEVAGTYLPEAEAVVRLRVVAGRPAVEVLTPLRTADGRVIAVDRGYVAAAEGRTVPPFAPPPAGPVTVAGRLRVNEPDPQGRSAITADGHLQVYGVDSGALAAATGLDLVPGYLQLDPAAAGALGPLPVAPSTGGAPFTNLSYALQWLTFGAIALVALGYFVRLEMLQRRR
jgi:cytochrome oxidase assembly protein ShyY1